MKQVLPIPHSSTRPACRLAGLILAAPLLLTAGCATIVSGTRQKIDVVTDPPGATASVGPQTVTTPGVLRLPRRSKEIGILVEKPGYATCSVSLKRKQGALTFLNLLGIPAGAAAGTAIGGASATGLAVLGAGAVGFTAGAVLVPAAALAVDYGTGAAYRLEPERVEITLEAAEPEASDPEDGIGNPNSPQPPPACVLETPKARPLEETSQPTSSADAAGLG